MTVAPRVSVIIPCYNQGAYLTEAIDSVLAQTVRDFEILVVDDGSTDQPTRDLFDSARWPRTQLFCTDNRGLAEARNYLLKRTRGEYLCALDSDDKLHPQYLEKTLERIERDRSLTFVSTRLQMFGDQDGVFPADLRCDLPTLLADCPIFPAALVRTAAVTAIGGYATMLEGDKDWDVWISLLEAGAHGVILPDVLFYYRRRVRSMCDQCTKRDAHLRLLAYLMRKHRASYHTHLLDVLQIKERQERALRRERTRLERELTDYLTPVTMRRHEELQHLSNVLAQSREEHAKRDELAALRTEYERAIAEVTALRSSGSWRLTAPLRALYDRVRRQPNGDAK